jgi:hypothetical protein
MAITPAQPISVLVNRSRAGKLNSDTDILELRDGDYPDRLNVEFNADEKLFSDTPALGNKSKLDIGEQGLQQQKVRIYLDTFFTQATIDFYNKNEQLLQSFTATPASQSLLGMKNAIVQAFSTLAWYGIVYDNETNTKEYIDVTINAELADYVLSVVDIDGTVIQTNILVEAISKTGEGKYVEIGSKDLLGTTWLLSTTQKDELKKLIDVYRMYQIPAYGGQICIRQPSHGLSSYDSIIIANASGLGAAANGEWTVNVIDNNNFGLFLSQPGAMPTTLVNYGGTIYINPYGVGQIGVQQYVGESDTYTYIKLIASKRFNFTTKHQIDVDAVLNNNGYLLKFTDDYNYPRTFSYQKEFEENGALTPWNINGYYTYETLADEIKNIINYSSARVDFENQVQSGGSVPPANWRYAVRFLTDTNASTEVSIMSNPIPTYPPEYVPKALGGGANLVYGAAIGITVTSKINRVRVSGITPNLFKFIELIGFNYASSSSNSTAVTAFVIRRELLNPNQTEIVLEHNGNEPDITFFDVTTSQSVRPDIIRVGSNRFCENRLVYGNITTSNELDLRDWAKTFKYSIKRKEIGASFGPEMIDEFYDPANTPNFTGYQNWEWYRFYIEAETYSGKITNSAFSFDMRFLSIDDYNSFGDQEFLNTNGGLRRDLTNDEMVDYSLGRFRTLNGVPDNVLYQLYVEINNIDWNYAIGGIKVKDLFKSVKISRAERVKEVLASGDFIGGCFPAYSLDPIPTIPIFTDWRFYNYITGPGESYDGVNGRTQNFPPRRNIGSIYAPDIIYGETVYEYQNGDQLITFGCNPVQQYNPYPNPTSGTIDNSAVIYNPRLSPSTVTPATSVAQIIDINASLYIEEGGTGTVGTSIYTKGATANPSDLLTNMTLPGSPVLSLDSDVSNQAPTDDNGKYSALIFRRKKDKYGSADAFGNIVVFTGTTVFNGETSASVFGGDVFCQQTFFRGIIASNHSVSPGYSAGWNIISSNIVNTNLRAYDPITPTAQFPVNPTTYTLWLFNLNGDVYEKNIGYSIFNNVQANTVYNPYGLDTSNYITRKYYSQLNPNNALTDKYREFLPLDFQDNPNSFGPITHLEVVNGELFTLQQRGFTREFFNATGRLQTVEDGDVLIGNGSVLSRKGLRLTMLGTNQKWSVCKGFSSSGKETIIWVNDEFGCVVRFGADGTVNISERAMMNTFFRERMRFVIGKDSPADNEGIHTVWDNIGKNFIITSRAWKDSSKWTDTGLYVVGTTVIYGEVLGVPQLYLCLLPQNTGREPGTPNGAAYWLKIELTNIEYYNVYTIAFNEQKNAFTHRYSFYPRIYHTQNNRYFSPSPYDGESNIIYRHRDKDAPEIVFYGRDNEGFTEYVINYMSRIVKKFIAHAQTALLKPKRVEFETQFISENGIDNRRTYLAREDFTMRENQAFSPIKNNLDSQGRNDQPTAPMTGLWLKMRTFFAANEKQKINDTTAVIRSGQRNVENP